MDKVMQWLSANIPATDQDGTDATLIHGDYRLDNMIFHPEKAEILAVLDWELSTLGNPLSDLGYFSMLYHLPGDTTGVPGLGGIDLDELGMPGEQEFAFTYMRHMYTAANSGGTVSGDFQTRVMHCNQSQAQRYFVVFSLFRLAAIAQGVYFRHKQGIASAANAEAVGRMAEPCAQLALSIIRS